MGRKYNYVDIDFAVRVLNHPELIDDDEMRLWLRDEGHCRLLEELRRVREGSLRTVDGLRPDVNLEWEKLSRKLFRKRILRVYRIAMATACIGILISVGWLWSRPSPVMQEDLVMVPVEEDHVESEGVTLVLNDGEEICLNRENEALLMQRLPQTFKVLSTDSLGGLVYTPRQLMGKSEELHTLKVPRGGEYFVILDDGTKVWLNSETEFRYPVTFEDERRVVELSGEAYFQVVRDEKRPFIVKTRGLQTRVLGTEFNVQAYLTDKVNVTLVNGQVAVKVPEDSREILLKPNENALYSQGKVRVSKEDVMKFISWKEGYFYYDNERLEDILTELGRWYNFTVIYEDLELKELRFQFWADRKDTFRKVLEHLNEMKKLKIEDQGNCIVVCR